jgi:hypothetical protein
VPRNSAELMAQLIAESSRGAGFQPATTAFEPAFALNQR